MAEEKYVNFKFGNATDTGLVRTNNEDYFGYFETQNGYLFLVCDGMGGHVGGSYAAQIAVNKIKECLQQNKYTTPQEALKQSFIVANSSILNYAYNNPEFRGMGTTCVAVLIVGSDVYYAHVGDSRIYILSSKKLYRLTKDHSFVQHLVSTGAISEADAEKHPRKNEISMALGMTNMDNPTVCSTSIKPAKGDILLLCSDGLTGMLNDKKITQVLIKNLSIQEKANYLINKANENGGTDNITVQLIEIKKSLYKKTTGHISSYVTKMNTKLKRSRIIALSAIGVAIILLGIILTNKEQISLFSINPTEDSISNKINATDTTSELNINKETLHIIEEELIQKHKEKTKNDTTVNPKNFELDKRYPTKTITKTVKSELKPIDSTKKSGDNTKETKQDTLAQKNKETTATESVTIKSRVIDSSSINDSITIQ